RRLMLRLVRSPDAAAKPAAATAGEQADPLRALATRAVAGDDRAQRTLLVALGPALLRAAVVGRIDRRLGRDPARARAARRTFPARRRARPRRRAAGPACRRAGVRHRPVRV